VIASVVKPAARVRGANHAKATQLAQDAERSIAMALGDLKRGDRVDAIDALQMATTQLRQSIAASRGELR
jgi:hypothetical protein